LSTIPGDIVYVLQSLRSLVCMRSGAACHVSLSGSMLAASLATMMVGLSARIHWFLSGPSMHSTVNDLLAVRMSRPNDSVAFASTYT
jgi:hypothetical protein